MRYFVEDGLKTVEAATIAELVTKLREGDEFGSKSDAEYMVDLADRFWDFYGGSPPRTDTPENFIADLLADGWLQQIGE